MRCVLLVLAMAVSIALLAAGVAVADTVTTNFEAPAFHTGSVNGQPVNVQPGWKSAPPGAIPSCNPLPTAGEYDQRVVANGVVPAAFGLQSLRMSNLCGNGEFFNQTYSTPVASPAGEDRANTEYDAQFSFISKTPNAEQPGLFITVSPDSYEGSRMSKVILEDTDGGIHIWITDTPNEDGEFVDYDAGVFDRSVPHTIRFWIKLNPGVDNDVVKIFIDGNDVGKSLGQCFTTWENYYRTSPEQAPPPNVNTPADINSLQFRSAIQGPARLAQTGGYLFDNVTVTTANGPGPAAGCGDEPPIDVDKTTQTRSALPGDLITYRITVTNRGRVPTRSVRACDRAPRALRFVGASRRLHRAAGRRLCLRVPVLQPHQHRTFRATFAVRAGVPAGTITNGASVDTPSGSTPSPVPPERARNPHRRRVDRDSARIRVRSSAEGPCGAAATLNRDAHAAC